MKILLLTDVPPCTNHTGGIVLSQIVKVLPPGSVACFCAMDPTTRPGHLDPELDWMPLEYAAKPRESGLLKGGRVREMVSYVAERGRRAESIPRIVNAAVAFARRHACDTIWGLLEGQTMVRLVPRVANALGFPLYTQVWDPLGWRLRAFHVDRWTSRAVQAEFDDTIRRSRAVATASDAMSAEYERLYHVRSVALIASHNLADSFTPEPRVREERELVIGMAGQIYAVAEWQALVRALNAANWKVGKRSVRLLVLGRDMPEAPIPEGRSHFVGWVSQREAIRLLSEQADILFCPYPFAAEMVDVSRLSFPSKLVSYLAAGRPIVFHGPDFSAPARYLSERGAGVVTLGSGAANVFNAIERLAGNPALYAKVAQAGRNAFLEDFTLERLRERVLSFFETTIPALTPAAPPLKFGTARLPSWQDVFPDWVLVCRLFVERAKQTPAGPLIAAAVGSVRGYLHWKHVRVARRLSALLRAELGEIEQRLRLASEHSTERAVAEAWSRELECAVRALKEQLDASRTAYTQLAETNAAMKQRIEDVSFAALARMTSVEENVRKLVDGTRAAAPDTGAPCREQGKASSSESA